MPGTNNMLAFDTLSYTKELEQKGFSREQAESLAMANRKYIVKPIEDSPLVTKSYLDKVVGKLATKKEFHHLEKRFDQLETRVEKLELKLLLKLGLLMTSGITILAIIMKL